MGLIYTCSASGRSTGDGRRHGVYLGGKKEAKSLEKLQQWNISHILNVTPTKEVSIQAGVPNYFEKPSSGGNSGNSSGGRTVFTYKRIPIYDASTSVSELENVANDIVNFISTGLYHGSVLVHCHQGVSRSTTCVLLYLMRKVGFTLPDALEMIKRRRPNAQPIPAFMNWLRKEERKLAQEAASGAAVGEEDKEVPKKKAAVVGPMRGPTKGPMRGPTAAPDSSNSNGKRPATDNDQGVSSSDNKEDDEKAKKRARIDKIIGPSRGPPTTSTSQQQLSSLSPSSSLRRPKSWASINGSNRNRPPSPTRDPMGVMANETMCRSSSLPMLFGSPPSPKTNNNDNNKKEGEKAEEAKTKLPAATDNTTGGDNNETIGPQLPPTK